VTLPPEFRDDDVADMPTHACERITQRMPYRHPPDDPRALEGKEKRRWNIMWREIHTSFLLSEHP
jgi:hypothetical protein